MAKAKQTKQGFTVEGKRGQKKKNNYRGMMWNSHEQELKKSSNIQQGNNSSKALTNATF